MVYVRRHPILSTTPAGPSGRLTPAWRAAAVLAAVFTAGLFTSTFFSSRSSGGLSGPKSNEPAPNAAAPPEQGKATRDPIIPGPDTHENPQDPNTHDSDTRNPAIRGAQNTDTPAMQDPNVPNVPQAPPVPPLGPNPRLNLWLDRGMPADPGSAPRAPEAGSQPSVAPLANDGPPPALVAQDRPTHFPHRSTGQMLFLTGFLLLLLSIGGLVTVGIYRRRW
jgi:hypothetical protein